MHCHICDREAVGRCYTCGQLFCADHGEVDCNRCQTAIAAGDPRPDRISAVPLSSTYRPGWWRPQIAEEFEPPACYECRGLARQTCGQCGSRFCPEHAGGAQLCAECGRSSLLGVYILLAMLFMLGLLMLAGAMART